MVVYAPRADRVVATQTVRTNRNQSDADRVRDIISALNLLWREQGEPLATVAVETQYAGRGPAQSASTMRGPATVRGAVMAWAWLSGLDVVEVAPHDAKRALTGKARASKQQMMGMATARYGLSVTEHEADALGMALVAARGG